MSPHELSTTTAIAVCRLRRAILVDRLYRSTIYTATAIWALFVLATDVSSRPAAHSASTILRALGIPEDFVGALLLAIAATQILRIWRGRPTRWYSWVMHCAVLALWISSAIVLVALYGGGPIAGLAAMITIIGCGLATMVVGRVEKNE
jgi:hypothetical protein